MTAVDSTTGDVAGAGSTRRWLKLAAKVAGSVALVYLVLRNVDLERILAEIGGARPELVLAAFSLNITGFLFSVIRWRILMRAQGADEKLRELCSIYLIGVFFGCFLPGFLLGGDVIRAQATGRTMGSYTISYLTVGIDRFTGLVVFAAFAAGALILGGSAVAGLGVVGPIAAFAGFVTIVALMLYLPAASSLLAWAGRIPRLGKLGLIDKSRQGLEAFRSRPSALAHAMVWAVILQLNVILYYCLIGAALGASPGVLAYFITVPLVLTLLLLPVSINGVGLREQLFLLMLAPFGVDGAQAVALAWIDLGLYLGIGMVGGIVFLGRRREILALRRTTVDRPPHDD